MPTDQFPPGTRVRIGDNYGTVQPPVDYVRVKPDNGYGMQFHDPRLVQRIDAGTPPALALDPKLVDLAGVIKDELELAHSGEGYEPQAVAEQIVKDHVKPMLAERVAEAERDRAERNAVAAMLEQMETQHVTWTVEGRPEEIHPDWCRECRVDRLTAALAVLQAGDRNRVDRLQAAGTATGCLLGADIIDHFVAMHAELAALKTSLAATLAPRCPGTTAREHDLS